MQVKAVVRGVQFKGVTVERVPSLKGCVEAYYVVKLWSATLLHYDLCLGRIKHFQLQKDEKCERNAFIHVHVDFSSKVKT